MGYKGDIRDSRQKSRKPRLGKFYITPHPREIRKPDAENTGMLILGLASEMEKPARGTRLNQFQSIGDEEAITAIFEFVGRDMDTDMENFILREVSRRGIWPEDLELLVQRLKTTEREGEKILAAKLIVANMTADNEELFDLFAYILINDPVMELKRISIGAFRRIDNEKSVKMLGQCMDDITDDELRCAIISALSESRVPGAFYQLAKQFEDIERFLGYKEQIKVNLVIALERFVEKNPTVRNKTYEILQRLSTDIEDRSLHESLPWEEETNRILGKMSLDRRCGYIGDY